MSSKKKIRKFDKKSWYYEKRRKKGSFDERWRGHLLREVKGRILEVAVGAGANLKFYPSDAEITGLDFSPQMLEKAEKAAFELGISAKFKEIDLENWNGESEPYDFVISTLSLCGYNNPVRVVRAMAASCKPGGQLLFMEHGLSKHSVARTFQKWADPLNVRYAGCHINRDIEGIVKSSGICVSKIERRFFGIIYLVWARPLPLADA